MADNSISRTKASRWATVPTRRGFLGSALGGLSVFLGSLALSGCARGAQSGAPQSSEGQADGEGPGEDCVSSLTGLELRAVEEGQAVTMDYREDRLTLVLDKQQRIARAYIG